MTNFIALALDRLGAAEMSCIAGLGGDVKPLVRTARSGRPIVAIDGCPLHCARHTLGRHDLRPDAHYDLSNMGVRKTYHDAFDRDDAERVLQHVLRDPVLARSYRSIDAPHDTPEALAESAANPSDSTDRAKDVEDR